MMRTGAYICPAGVTHHDKATKVARWQQEEMRRTRADVAKIVRAHNDYLAGMELFRERRPERVVSLDPAIKAWYDGYEAAVRDMDESLLDAMRRRPDEEEA